jgi:sugar lactone lactonase YvrE
MTSKPEYVTEFACETGEGPLYHPDEHCLYWTDIPRGHMYRYDLDTGEHEQCYEGSKVGGFTIQSDGSLLLFKARGEITVWRDGEEEIVLKEIPEERDSRFNDVIADPEGRVLCGTMPPDGRLYRLDNSTVATLVSGVRVSNGMGFTPDHTQIYFAETEAETIWKFDYDAATGTLSNRRTFVETVGGPGLPDGLTVDAEGYVWSARWNGGCVVRHHPEDGRIVERVRFPARKVSCITFGGPDYEQAYVTTATGGNDRSIEGSGAGALFRFSPDVHGAPEFRSQIEP